DISAVKELIQAGTENKELKQDTPIEDISNTITDLLYGQMLCWALSSGSYSFEERTKTFCKIYLSTLLKEYLL
ncbi:MAG: TetR/AcrR family transcriptional regulator, partial [Clostridia bacterium]|nr:TetR/AcrR family transcriptional regulator [Clostridia bacterium]